MRWSGIVLLWMFVLSLNGPVRAQAQKPATSRSAEKKKSSEKKHIDNKGISVAKAGKKLKPTVNLDAGSVGYYFYPITPGSYWKMRTVKSLYDLQDKLIASDTLYHSEKVSTNSAPSMQGLPLIKCMSKSFRHGQNEDSVQPMETTYYVDDSLIMAVFNNSISHSENVSLLTTPLREGSVWPERYEDSIGTKIISMHESVETPAGTFDNAILTSTRLGFGELSKYFAPGNGIVKMIFRGVTGNGQGKVTVVTDLMEIHHELSGLEDESSTSGVDPTMTK